MPETRKVQKARESLCCTMHKNTSDLLVVCTLLSVVFGFKPMGISGLVVYLLWVVGLLMIPGSQRVNSNAYTDANLASMVLIFICVFINENGLITKDGFLWDDSQDCLSHPWRNTVVVTVTALLFWVHRVVECCNGRQGAITDKQGITQNWSMHCIFILMGALGNPLLAAFYMAVKFLQFHFFDFLLKDKDEDEKKKIYAVIEFAFLCMSVVVPTYSVFYSLSLPAQGSSVLFAQQSSAWDGLLVIWKLLGVFKMIIPSLSVMGYMCIHRFYSMVFSTKKTKAKGKKKLENKAGDGFYDVKLNLCSQLLLFVGIIACFIYALYSCVPEDTKRGKNNKIVSFMQYLNQAIIAVRVYLLYGHYELSYMLLYYVGTYVLHCACYAYVQVALQGVYAYNFGVYAFGCVVSLLYQSLDIRILIAMHIYVTRTKCLVSNWKPDACNTIEAFILHPYEASQHFMELTCRMLWVCLAAPMYYMNMVVEGVKKQFEILYALYGMSGKN